MVKEELSPTPEGSNQDSEHSPFGNLDLSVSHPSFLRLHETHSQRDTQDSPYSLAKAHLEERTELLSAVNPLMLRTAQLTARDYNIRLRGDFGSVDPEEKIDIEKLKYQALIKLLPDSVQGILKDEVNHAIDDSFVADLHAAFVWNFDRLKRVNDDSGIPQVEIATRYGTLDGNLIPYPCHTHIDVPHAMQRFGLRNSPLSILLALSHDSFEEGRNLYLTEANGGALAFIDTHTFFEIFQNQERSRMLAFGALSLTESSQEALQDHHQTELDSIHQKVQSLMQADLQRFPEMKDRVTKIYAQDPAVFGGLSLQVYAATSMLLDPNTELSINMENRLQLVKAIIDTEMGDRFSDISTLDGDLEWFPEDLDFAKLKITAYICRMLNMHQTLSKCVSILPESERASYDQGLEGYLGMIAVKIDQINEQLIKAGTEPMSFDSIQDFLEGPFLQAHQEVELQLGPVMQKKVETMLGVCFGQTTES